MSDPTLPKELLPDDVPMQDDGYYAGEKERHRSRETGTVVVLIDAQADRRWNPRPGGRWITLCREHGRLTRWPSLGIARSWYAYPSIWCGACDQRLARREGSVPG